MKQNNTQILKTAFNYEKQGYMLVKAMLFVYAFKKAKITYPLYKEGEKNPSRYLENLLNIMKNNLSKIEENFSSLIKDCICSYSYNVFSNDEIKKCLLILDEMTTEDIRSFIINDINSVGKKENFSSPKNLIDLVIKILYKNETQSWLDLGCGNGDFLVELTKNHKKAICYGDEINYNSMLLTKIRLYFIGVPSIITETNILSSSYDEKVDVAYVNTPFILRLSKKLNNLIALISMLES